MDLGAYINLECIRHAALPVEPVTDVLVIGSSYLCNLLYQTKMPSAPFVWPTCDRITILLAAE